MEINPLVGDGATTSHADNQTANIPQPQFFCFTNTGLTDVTNYELINTQVRLTYMYKSCIIFVEED